MTEYDNANNSIGLIAKLMIFLTLMTWTLLILAIQLYGYNSLEAVFLGTIGILLTIVYTAIGITGHIARNKPYLTKIRYFILAIFGMAIPVFIMDGLPLSS